jgi:hypothetical protein
MQLISATDVARFTLGQAWEPVQDERLEPTEVAATYQDGRLHVVAKLWDKDIYSAATAHNQRTWELGDVFEIFFRREDSQSYSEVHVTPGNIRLHLQLRDFQHHLSITDIAEIAADPGAIESEVSTFDGGWQVRASVPILAQPGDILRVSFCRYDVAKDWPEPILSSSSPHPVRKFHRPDEWLPVRVGP